MLQCWYRFLFLMILRPPIATLTDSLVSSTSIFRSRSDAGPACRPDPGLLRHPDRQPDGRAGADRRHQAASAGLRPHGGVARRSEEHTSELQSLMRISYAALCL